MVNPEAVPALHRVRFEGPPLAVVVPLCSRG
jgi:hypothetical protein